MKEKVFTALSSVQVPTTSLTQTFASRHVSNSSEELVHKVSNSSEAIAFTFIGCYRNEGSNRVVGHLANQNISQCWANALMNAKPYFGMEWPQGFAVDGAAECLML